MKNAGKTLKKIQVKRKREDIDADTDAGWKRKKTKKKQNKQPENEPVPPSKTSTLGQSERRHAGGNANSENSPNRHKTGVIVLRIV